MSLLLCYCSILFHQHPTLLLFHQQPPSHIVSGPVLLVQVAVDRRRSQSSATEEISSLAKLQSAYYKRKLEMKEEQHALYIKEHERKAKVYDLQEQYYAAKLRKLAEE